VIATSALSIPEIRRHLTASVIGRHIYLFADVDSTNARLKALARAGARAGTVLIADGQTAGRGRHGQTWFSPSGVNLYASVLFRPDLHPRELGVFSLLAALALADAITEFGATATIKWPNDVLIDGRKVGASLLESGGRRDAVDYVILGVGVNLNIDRSALRSALGPSGAFATSLAETTGQDIDRNAFAAAYLNHLDRWASVGETQGPKGSSPCGGVVRFWAVAASRFGASTPPIPGGSSASTIMAASGSRTRWAAATRSPGKRFASLTDSLSRRGNFT
jgi:BirA family biotin operon repressor/biotin-[acetyl-CoA-carboxylase] ligase